MSCSDDDPDVSSIATQERRLVLTDFNIDLPWLLGCALKSMAEARGLTVVIEIRVARKTVFLFAMPGCSPANANWARRKRNTVELLHRSSYRVGCELRRDDLSLEQAMGFLPFVTTPARRQLPANARRCWMPQRIKNNRRS